MLNMVWSVGQGSFPVSRVDVVTPSGMLQEFSTLGVTRSVLLSFSSLSGQQPENTQVSGSNIPRPEPTPQCSQRG